MAAGPTVVSSPVPTSGAMKDANPQLVPNTARYLARRCAGASLLPSVSSCPISTKSPIAVTTVAASSTAGVVANAYPTSPSAITPNPVLSRVLVDQPLTRQVPSSGCAATIVSAETLSAPPSNQLSRPRARSVSGSATVV